MAGRHPFELGRELAHAQDRKFDLDRSFEQQVPRTSDRHIDDFLDFSAVEHRYYPEITHILLAYRPGSGNRGALRATKTSSLVFHDG